MFLFPLHVVNVPGDCCHADDRILHHLIARVTLIKVFGEFLREEGRAEEKRAEEKRGEENCELPFSLKYLQYH